MGEIVFGAQQQEYPQQHQQRFQWGQQQPQQSESQYERRYDPATRSPYYFNTITGQSTWTPPAGWQEPSEEAGVPRYDQAVAEDDDGSWE